MRRRKNKPVTTLIALVLIIALNLAGMGVASYRLVLASEPSLDFERVVRPQSIPQIPAIPTTHSQPYTQQSNEQQTTTPRITTSNNQINTFMNRIGFEDLIQFANFVSAQASGANGSTISSGSGNMLRFYRAGVLRIPEGEATRLDPVAGGQSQPSRDSHDDSAIGQNNPAQDDFENTVAHAHELDHNENDITDESPEQSEPREGAMPDYNYDYNPPEYDITELENEVIYSEDTENDYDKGELAMSYSENIDDDQITICNESDEGIMPESPQEPGGGADGMDDESPEAGASNNEGYGADLDTQNEEGTADDPAPESSESAEENDDAGGAGAGNPQDDDANASSASGNEAAEEANEQAAAPANEDSQNQPQPPRNIVPRTNSGTPNPQTSDDFAFIGLAVSSVGFLSSSLILLVIMFERRVKG